VRRRNFIAFLGGVAAWPLAAHGQQAMPVIGYLGLASATVMAPRVAGFKQGLSETGYVEGQNVAIEYRYADNQFDRVSALAADLVRQKPALIYANALQGFGPLEHTLHRFPLSSKWARIRSKKVSS
jgi:ABC-type uncharacterized transport system substrate-binding protein